ncbi:DUF4245 domain-containing protein [Streptomyces sp. NBC_01497]|uniref:DUF4245 domain-containing protein n=1 Tax=Streptomyces sp. NBC_01497 TaxID=2903885 RepID=UPI003FCC6DAC
MAGDEQQGATTAETAAPAAAPTAEESAGQSTRQTAGPDADPAVAGGTEPTAGGEAARAGAGSAAPDVGRPGDKPGGGSRRRERTVRGMFLSLLVIGAAVAVIYTFFIPHDDKADPVKRVDYRVELITARRAAPYQVAAPAGLPKTWKATSVTYDQSAGNAWHLGFLDPTGQYVAIEQSTSPTNGYVTNVSQNAKKTGRTQEIAGKQWQRWKGGHYDALVHTEGKATTVVTGTASYTGLAKMAAALRFVQTKA